MACANCVQRPDETRDGLSGPLLTVPNNPDSTTDGVPTAAGWETEPVLPPVVSASTSVTMSPTETAAAIRAMTRR